MHKLIKLNLKSILINYLLYAILFSVAGYLYLLSLNKILMILLLLLCTIPIHIYCEQKNEHEKKRFNELIIYLNNVVMNYKINGKIRKSLIETAPLFDDGSMMKSCINKSIQMIDEGDDLLKALKEIENQYCNSYVKQIHQYMVLGEMNVGSAVFASLSQVNFRQWQTNVELLQHEKQKIKKNNFKYAIIALAISYVPYPFLMDFISGLRNDQSYQMITFLFFCSFVCMYAIIPFLLNGKWINEKE